MIHCGDALAVLRRMEPESVHCCVTSPPYWGLRDYGVPGQIGLERTPEEYISRVTEVFREVRRVLRADGTLWLNIGDSYANDGKCGGETGGKQAYLDDNNRRRVGREKRLTGLKPKDIVGIPWMLAFALRADGWYLRSDIIWYKPNPMPESVTDRPTKAHEYIFLLAKSERYYYDAAAIAESSLTGDDRKPFCPGQVDYRGNGHDRGGGRARTAGNKNHKYESRNKRSVWKIATQPNSLETSRRVRVEVDGPCDGSQRTTSQDCPLHGDHPVLVSSALCGVREDDSSIHSEHNASNRAPEQPTGFSPIGQSHAPGSSLQNSGSIPLECSGVAIGHSRRKSKTARAPETNRPYMPSSRTFGDTGDSPERLSTCGSVERTPESNSAVGCAQDGPGLDPSGRIQTDNAGKCTCKHYITKTEKIMHFATFPEALVEPCIKAGCPLGGVVLDPFCGSGTTGLVAKRLACAFVGIELNPAYIKLAEKRMDQEVLEMTA